MDSLEYPEESKPIISIPVGRVRELFGKGTLSGQEIMTLVSIESEGTIIDRMTYDGPVAEVFLSVMTPTDKAEIAVEDGIEIFRCFEPRDFAKAFLYNTWVSGKVHLIGVGRYYHNQLQPSDFSNVTKDYGGFSQCEEWAAECEKNIRHVSREHGWVFFSNDGKVMYRDVGTKLNGQRTGSMNGTWVNGTRQILDECIEWNEADWLGIGGMAYFSDESDKKGSGHFFRLTYKSLGSPLTGKTEHKE